MLFAEKIMEQETNKIEQLAEKEIDLTYHMIIGIHWKLDDTEMSSCIIKPPKFGTWMDADTIVKKILERLKDFAGA